MKGKNIEHRSRMYLCIRCGAAGKTKKKNKKKERKKKKRKKEKDSDLVCKSPITPRWEESGGGGEAQTTVEIVRSIPCLIFELI